MAPPNWILISNTFAPFESVPPDKLDEWFVSRPDSPVTMLASLLSPDRIPQRRILVGQPASGKSSEMTKLASELEKRHNALVVRFDMMDNIEVERANPIEVIYIMGAAVYKAAASQLPPDRQPERQLIEDLTNGLETLVQTHTENSSFKIDLTKLIEGIVVFAGAALIGPVGAVAGIAAAKGAGSFLSKINPFRFTSGTDTKLVRKVEVEPNVQAMADTLNAIIDDVTVKSNRPLILLVDGLDKMRDEEVISLNFLENDYLNRPKCSVLYAGPLDVYYAPQFGGVRARFYVVPFSHVKLHDRNTPDQIYEGGYEVLREVVRRRVESIGMKVEDVIEMDALDMIIKGSAGVMRDFIRLVQSATLQAEIAGKDRIGKPEAAKVLNEIRRQLQAQLTPEYKEVLRKVRQTHERLGGKDDGEKCDLLLRNDIVLSYFNDDVWFAPHAALTEEPWKG